MFRSLSEAASSGANRRGHLDSARRRLRADRDPLAGRDDAAEPVALSGAKTYRSETAQLAGRAGNKAAGFIARFAATEGWITQEQAQNAESFL
jgi:hypothetical protein